MSKPLKMLVYGLSSDKLAGIETYTLNLVSSFPDDIKADYVIEAKSSIHEEAIRQMGSKVFYLPPKKKMLNNALAWLRLISKKRKEYDVVYFNMYSLSWIVPICLCRLYGMPVVVHAHNKALHTGGVLLLLHRLGRCLLRKMEVLRLTNSPLSSKFFYYPEDRVELAYTAIDTDRFRFREERREGIRRQCGFAERNVYSFFGRLVWQKNPLFLMDVFFEIAKLDKNASFLVVGDGDMREQVKEKARQLSLPVLFVGVRRDTEALYDASDLLVFPSMCEGLGIVLIEAQCSGLPCVYSAEVIPELARVTDLCDLVNLSEPPKRWAEVCVSQREKCKGVDRESYPLQIRDAGFSLNDEAKRMARIFQSYVDECKK